jgi:hypothetical protein
VTKKIEEKWREDEQRGERREVERDTKKRVAERREVR